MRSPYNPGGSFSEQAEYLLHDRGHCKGGCDRHPLVCRDLFDLDPLRIPPWRTFRFWLAAAAVAAGLAVVLALAAGWPGGTR